MAVIIQELLIKTSLVNKDTHSNNKQFQQCLDQVNNLKLQVKELKKKLDDLKHKYDR